MSLILLKDMYRKKEHMCLLVIVKEQRSKGMLALRCRKLGGRAQVSTSVQSTAGMAVARRGMWQRPPPAPGEGTACAL